MREKMLKLLCSKSSEDIRLGIEFLLSMGYNKANDIFKDLPDGEHRDIWKSLGCHTPFWGYFNSTRGTFRIIVANYEMLVMYKTGEYVKNELGWKNLEL